MPHLVLISTCALMVKSKIILCTVLLNCQHKKGTQFFHSFNLLILAVGPLGQVVTLTITTVRQLCS